MYVSILSGQVARENWNHLQHSFKKICMRPPEGLQEIELVQSVDDANFWQVITTWSSAEAYQEAKRQNRTAPCEQMFCDAGSIPQRAEYKMVTRYERVST